MVHDGPTIGAEDPLTEDVRALVEAHLAFARAVTPAGHVHALGIESLVAHDITLFAARRLGDGALVGVGALRELAPDHGEVKSMHVRSDVRGAGTGRAIVDHLVTVARARGYRRVSLETGTDAAFAPARTLYERVGFVPCPPFADYTDNPFSVCMTLVLGDDTIAGDDTIVENGSTPRR